MKRYESPPYPTLTFVAWAALSFVWGWVSKGIWILFLVILALPLVLTVLGCLLVVNGFSRTWRKARTARARRHLAYAHQC